MRLTLSFIAVLALAACSSGTSGGTSTGSSGSHATGGAGSSTSAGTSAGASTGSATNAGGSGSTGTAAGASAGSSSGGSAATTGASAGATTGASAGATSGASAGATSGASAGATSGASAGATTGASAGATTGASAGATSGTTGGASAGTAGSSSGGTSGAGNTILLVDNDGYVNDGSGTDATVLSAYQGFLTGAGVTAFDILSIASDGSQSWGAAATPSAAQLAAYDAVIWFAADNGNANQGSGDAPLSSDQEALLASWLGTGHKKLVIISEYLVSVDLPTSATCLWSGAPTDPLFTTYVPVTAGDDDPEVAQQNGGGDLQISDTGYGVAGGSAVSSAFAALQWTIDSSTTLQANLPPYTAGAVEPGTDVDVLATVQADPSCGGTNAPIAVVVGAKNAGGTSTVVYSGIEPLNVTGGATAQQFMTGLLQTYAGLP